MTNYFKYIGILLFTIGIFYDSFNVFKLSAILILFCYFVIRIIKQDNFLLLKLNSLFYIINLLLTAAYLILVDYNSVISLLIKIIFIIQLINIVIIHFKNDPISRKPINLYIEYLILSFLIISQLYPLSI